jgi:hypothetical protein
VQYQQQLIQMQMQQYQQQLEISRRYQEQQAVRNQQLQGVASQILELQAKYQMLNFGGGGGFGLGGDPNGIGVFGSGSMFNQGAPIFNSPGSLPTTPGGSGPLGGGTTPGRTR